VAARSLVVGRFEPMLYLLDANVLIAAHHSYYPIDRVPEFWNWLAFQGEQQQVKMPIETYEEVKDGSTDEERDVLFGWVSNDDIKAALLLEEEVDQARVAEVVELGYAPDLTDQEIEQLGRDPFLVAYALADSGNRCVVTTEVSSPRKQRQNRKVPDVCATMGVSCSTTFDMLRALGFSTAWRRP
jgi:hypothetical protein